MQGSNILTTPSEQPQNTYCSLTTRQCAGDACACVCVCVKGRERVGEQEQWEGLLAFVN